MEPTDGPGKNFLPQLRLMDGRVVLFAQRIATAIECVTLVLTSDESTWRIEFWGCQKLKVQDGSRLDALIEIHQACP